MNKLLIIISLYFFGSLLTWSQAQSTDTISISVTVNMKTAADDGRPLGTVFELRNSGVIVGGAGFVNGSQSGSMINGRELQLYFGSNYSNQNNYSTEFVPRPYQNTNFLWKNWLGIQTPVTNNLNTYFISSSNGNLIAYPYNSGHYSVKSLTSNNSWSELTNPPFVQSRIQNGDFRFYQRVQNKDLVGYKNSVFFGNEQITLNGLNFAAGSGIADGSIYAWGKLFLILDNSSHTNALVVCDWLPGYSQASCKPPYDLPSTISRNASDNNAGACISGNMQYSAIPFHNSNSIILYDRSGRMEVVVFENDKANLSDRGASAFTRVRLENSPCDQSSQIYSAVAHKDNYWFGHYPSGAILKLAGSHPNMILTKVSPQVLNLGAGVCSLSQTQNCFDGVYRPSPEAQGLNLLGGQLWVGMWPSGELYHFSPGSASSRLTRAFSQPPLVSNKHPYEDEINNFRSQSPQIESNRKSQWDNCLGQRIPQVIAYKNGFVVQTRSKNNSTECFNLAADWYSLNPASAPFPNLNPYGAIYYYKRTNFASCPIEWKPSSQLKVELINSAITLKGRLTQDGVERCSFESPSSPKNTALFESIKNATRVYGGGAASGSTPYTEYGTFGVTGVLVAPTP